MHRAAWSYSNLSLPSCCVDVGREGCRRELLHFRSRRDRAPGVQPEHEACSPFDQDGTCCAGELVDCASEDRGCGSVGVFALWRPRLTECQLRFPLSEPNLTFLGFFRRRSRDCWWRERRWRPRQSRPSWTRRPPATIGTGTGLTVPVGLGLLGKAPSPRGAG